MKVTKPKCPRCGKNTKISRVESDFRNGALVSYCFSASHPRIRLRTILEKNISRNIRNDRMKKRDVDFSMKNMKCVICGKRLDFSKTGSSQASGKVVGYCWSGKGSLPHRLRNMIFGKPAYVEPNCDELFEVIVRESDI